MLLPPVHEFPSVISAISCWVRDADVPGVPKKSIKTKNCLTSSIASSIGLPTFSQSFTTNSYGIFQKKTWLMIHTKTRGLRKRIAAKQLEFTARLVHAFNFSLQRAFFSAELRPIGKFLNFLSNIFEF